MSTIIAATLESSCSTLTSISLGKEMESDCAESDRPNGENAHQLRCLHRQLFQLNNESFQSPTDYFHETFTGKKNSENWFRKGPALF